MLCHRLEPRLGSRHSSLILIFFSNPRGEWVCQLGLIRLIPWAYAGEIKSYCLDASLWNLAVKLKSVWKWRRNSLPLFNHFPFLRWKSNLKALVSQGTGAQGSVLTLVSAASQPVWWILFHRSPFRPRAQTVQVLLFVHLSPYPANL